MCGNLPEDYCVDGGGEQAHSDEDADDDRHLEGHLVAPVRYLAVREEDKEKM